MKSRLQNALEVRTAAAELAAARPHPTHYSNGDEGRFRFENVPDVTDPRHGNAPGYCATVPKSVAQGTGVDLGGRRVNNRRRRTSAISRNVCLMMPTAFSLIRQTIAAGCVP